MKIGFFTDGYLPQPNGVATAVYSSARELERQGHKVYIVAPKYPGYKDKMRVFRLTSVKIMKEPDMRVALQLPDKQLRKVLKIDFDIIHVHAGGPITFLGWEIAKAKNIPVVMTYHTLWNKYTHYIFKGRVINAKMVEQATKIFCNGCDYIVAPTQQIKKELEKYGIRRPVAVIPSGVDIESFSNHKKNIFREKKLVPAEDKLLLCVARLGKEKSIDFLLRSFKIILEKKPKTTLVLVGDGVEKKNLISLSKKLGISEKVVFAGTIDPNIRAQIYAGSDLFLFASQTETQGLVVLEALASSVPVVAVEDKVLEGVVVDDQNGFLLPKDEKIFANKVIDLLSDEKSRKRLSAQSKDSILKFSLESSIKNLEELYKKVLESRSRASIRKIMEGNMSHEQLFVTILSFWAVTLFVRLMTFTTHSSDLYPTFMLGAYSLPHIAIGLILFFFIAPFVIKRKELNIFTLILLGASLSFIFDDFWVFVTSGAQSYIDYWSRGNFIMLSLAGSIPVLFVRFVKKNRPEFLISENEIPHQNPENPKVSVVIPAFNEGKFIKKTLTSLLNQTYKDFELIVVDNNSTDDTGDVAKKLGARVILEEEKGVAFARQTGFMAAKGEIIATTDSDTIVQEDWVEKIVKGFDNKDIVGFGGLNRLYSGPVTARTATRYFATIFWIIDGIFSEGRNLLGSNFAVRKSAFLEINGFNTSLTLGEDVDLSQRLKRVGKVVLDTKLLVFSSGRRFRHGLFAGIATYAPSWFMRVVFKKDKYLKFPTIRSEKIDIGSLALLPFVFCIFLLTAIFYLANNNLFRAAPIRFIEKISQFLGEFYR